jgi:glucose-6-phosphate dehydrogenase assembly protein OpcA
VIWWRGKAPSDQAADEWHSWRCVGSPTPRHHPVRWRPESTCRAYAPGDTDLSWTRLTPWRALLAAALDQYPSKIKSAQIES